jgi:hypothetical protein
MTVQRDTGTDANLAYPIRPTWLEIDNARSLLTDPDRRVAWFSDPTDPQAVFECRPTENVYTEGGICTAEYLLASFGSGADVISAIEGAKDTIGTFTSPDGRLWGCLAEVIHA